MNYKLSRLTFLVVMMFIAVARFKKRLD